MNRKKTNKPKEPISIDKQFENYLKRVKINRAEISDVQYDETKKAFYAGFAAMLVLCQTSIPDLPEKQAVMEMEKLVQEAEFYWKVSLL